MAFPEDPLFDGASNAGMASSDAESPNMKRLKLGDPMFDKFQDMMVSVLAKQQAQFNSAMQHQMMLAQQHQQTLMLEFMKHSMSQANRATVVGEYAAAVAAAPAAGKKAEGKDTKVLELMLKKQKQKVKTSLRSEDTMKERKKATNG